MKFVACAIALFSLAYVAQPVIFDKYQQSVNDRIASACWSESSKNAVVNILRESVLDKIEDVERIRLLAAQKPPLPRSAYESNLTVEMHTPAAISVFLAAKGVECEGDISMKYADFRVNAVINYHVRKSGDVDGNVTISKAVSEDLFQELNHLVSSSPKK